MASRADIKAGAAYVELFLKDESFRKGLDAAGDKLKSWGKGVAIVGAAITAAGTAIVAPLTEMTREFAQAGSALFNMSMRTNEAVQSLAFLQYAAQQTDTDMKVIQRAMFRVQKAGKNFDDVAARIASIKDPAQQSMEAIKEFGVRSGPFLLPLLRDIQNLRDTWQELGLGKGLSNKDVAAAKELNDVFGNLTSVLKSVRNVIGAALAPVIKEMTLWITDIAVRVRDWIDSHRDLVVSAFNVGRVLIGVGTAITALGAGLYATGVIVGGFGSILGVAATLISALVSPVGLVIAALAAGVYMFGNYTASGKTMVATLKTYFTTLRETALETFEGISDALASGDFILAVKILWAGIKLEFLQGTRGLRESWYGFIDTAKQAWSDLSNHLTQVWSDFNEWFASTTITAKYMALDAWTEFAAKLVDVFVGVKTRIAEVYEYIKDMPKMLVTFDKQGNAIMDMDRRHRVNQQHEADQNKYGIDVDAEKKKHADAKQDELGKIKSAAAPQPNTVVATDKSAAVIALDKQLADAQAELDKLRVQAADERAAQKDRQHANIPGGGVDPNMMKDHIFGTFSAAALVASGGGVGGNPFESALTKKDQKEAQRHLALMRAIDRAWRIGP